ncbi:chemotaxis protein CheX [bacterium]|nr:chemotaxis protein CheX [bacterium]
MAQSDSEKCAQYFLQATGEVLKLVLNEAGVREEVTGMAHSGAVSDVVVILGLTGEAQEGRVLFELTHDTALRIVGAMNSGEEFDELNEMARATVAELGNLVAGRALTLFNDAGGNLHLSPPLLLYGVGIRIAHFSPANRMSVLSSLGEVGVNLWLRPKTNSARLPKRPAAGNPAASELIR